MPPVLSIRCRSLLAALAAACALVSAAVAAAEPPPFDARLTSAARLLAGADTDYAAHARVAALDAWQAHKATMGPKWERLQRERLSVIETWRNQTLGSDAVACRTLLYPFSGPDFMNAYLLFPRCDTYVMFGLEAPGAVPPFETRSAGEAGLVLKDIRVALTDFLERNYFIMSRMAKQLHTPHLKGVAPLMLASMGLLDVRVALPRGALSAALRGLRARLAPNGTLTLFITRRNVFMKPLIAYWWDANLYTAAELRSAFRDAGFAEVAFRHFPLPHRHLIVWGHIVEARALA